MYSDILSRQEIHLLLPQMLSKASKDSPFCLILMKPAEFRLLQTELTPLACDSILQKTANTIKKHAPASAKIGHWGGITFAILLPSYNKRTAEALAEKISLQVSFQDLPKCFTGKKISLIYAVQEAPPRSISLIGLQAEKSLAKEDGRFLPLFETNPIHDRFLKNFINSFLLANDSYLSQQSILSSRIANRIAVILGLKQKEREDIMLAASFCDIGMLLGGENLLLIPRALSPEEFNIVKKHPRFAANLSRSIGLSEEIAQAVLSHHERWDGSGYPRGLGQKEIPIYGGILGISNYYAALLLPRPYRRSFTPSAAKEIILNEANKAFDPELIRIFTLLPLEEQKLIKSLTRPSFV